MTSQTTLPLRARKAIVCLLVGALTVSPMLAAAQTYLYQKAVPGLKVTPPANPPGTPEVPPEATQKPIAEVSAGAVPFGSVGIGQTGTRTVVVTNKGDANLQFLEAPSVLGTGFSATTDCSAILAPDASCYVTINFKPTAPLPYSGSLALASNGSASPLTVDLSGQGTALEAVGQLLAGSGTNFGTPNVNTTTTKHFTFHNTGNVAATGIYAQISAFEGLVLSANTCGTAGAPASVSATGTCSMTVAWTPSTASSLAGAVLTVTGGNLGAAASLALSGTAGTFNAAAEWSTLQGSAVAFTGATNAYGTLTTGETLDKNLFLRNIGTHGSLAVGVTLSGDTSQFKVVALYRNANTGSPSPCGVVVTEGVSATPCLADDKNGGDRPNIWAVIRYAPTEIGNHSVTVTPTTNNGTALPEPIVLTGQGEFNPTAEWSTSPSTTVAVTGSPSAYGTLTTGATLDNLLYLRNVGTHGSLAVGVTLSGDTSQFRVERLYKVNGNANTSTCGAVVTEGVTATPCLTDDKKWGGGNHHIQVRVRYAPTEIGNHSVTVTPTTNNGTALPAPIVLTGQGEFNPTAVWSTSAGTTVAFTGATSTYGTLTVGKTAEKYMYLRNVGTHGPLAIGVNLSGDTSQFKVVAIKAARDLGDASSCVSGGALAGSASATPCEALDKAKGTGYHNIQLRIQYAPTEVGSHSITVTPATNNGTVLPEPIVLTGQGEFNPTAVWSTSPGTTVALTGATNSYGTLTAGATLEKWIYLRNVGTYGPLAVGVTLSGDTSQFKLVALYRNPNSSVSASCGAVVTNGVNTAPCVADDKNGGSYVNVQVRIQYAPTEGGSHSITVTPTTNNGTVLPEPIVLTGSRG